MALRLLLIAMVSGAAVSATILAFSGPLWLVLLAYPATGTVTLLGALVLVGLGRDLLQIGDHPSAPPSAHCPVPRSTTPTVATNTLISVASDSLRS